MATVAEEPNNQKQADRTGKMSPIQSISSVFRNYVNFRGRAQRSEFWWFTLFIVVSQVILGFIPVPFIGAVYLLAVLLPSLAVTARRLHDTDRSVRWWIITLLTGFLGTIALIAFLFWAAIGSGGSDGYGALGLVLGIGLFLLAWLFVNGVGVIVLLVLCALPGTVGPNRYGPDPLRPELGDDMTRPPAHPYSATPAAVEDGSPGNDAAPTESLPETEPDNQRYCTQCGMQLQPEARFCSGCGAAF